jgi:superfamily II DNA or RNA helicase
MAQTWELWDHQQDAVDRINEDWKSGKNSICCQLCTGGGKSRIIRTIVDQWADRKKVIYIIAHRNTLVKQLSEELTEAGLQHGIIKSGSPYIKYRVQVCSMQTLVRRLDKLPEPSLIVVDECFPMGTFIDGFGRIEDIQVGCYVDSYSEKENKIVRRKVLSTFKKELKDDLIHIKLDDNKELICTKNHPIMTNRGWLKADEIGVKDGILCDLWKSDKGQQKNMFSRMFTQKTFSNNGKNKQGICKRQNVKEQSNAQCRNKRKGIKDFKRNRTQTLYSRWKWKTNANTATNVTRKIRGSRLCGRMCSTNKNGKIFRIPHMLQNRFRKSSTKARNRNRWEFSLLYKKTGTRQKENRSIGYIRVASVEVQKYRSRQWLESMHGSNYVYNFEVEETNTYLVNNCVVHNCHHLKSHSYETILNKWNHAKLLGMTATPQRSDGKPLDVFQILELGPSMRSLIDRGSLSDYDYYAPENIDMSDVHIRAGEYVTKESEEKIDKTVITGNAIEHYKRYADHKPAICCCISIAHSEHVAQEFRDAGYKAVAVNSKMKVWEIEKAINGLRDGSLEILTQCDMLGEGVDIKGAEVLIGLRPTQSLVIYLQHAGRVLRAAPGKEKAIILDHVGNWERFGLPDDERDWSLAGKPKKDKGQSHTKRCPECLRVVSSSTRICPHCGYQWVESAEVGTRQIEEKEGQLVAIKTVSHMQQQELIRTIAKKAHNLKQAILVAKKNGYDHRAGFTIWTKTLKHGKNDYVKF